MNQEKGIKKVLILLVAVLLLVGSTVVVYQQYTESRTAVQQLTSENNVLENRILILQEAQQYVSQYVPSAIDAVPESNSGFHALAAVRSQAIDSSLLIDNVNVKASSIAEQDISNAELQFEISGDVSTIMDFTDRLFSTLPVMNLFSLNYQSTGDLVGQVQAQLVLRAISKPFPVQLPSLSETLSPLTLEDRLFLDDLSTYTTPTLYVETDDTDSDAIPFGRPNPFAAAEVTGTVGIDEDSPVVLE